MAKPLIAIVGRPNVGKSMLFNKLTGRRSAIVEDTPGVTRDRIYGSCDWNGREFELVDTGGIEPNTDSDMLKFMRRQAEIAIDAALRRAKAGTYRIRLIHGYQGGTALRNMIRTKYRSHPKVLRLEMGMNQGQTDLILREYF